MWKIVVFLLLFSNLAYANDITKHVTFDYWKIPGSYSIKYGGIYGRAVNEITSQIEKIERKRINQYEKEGQIDYLEMLQRHRQLTLSIGDMKQGNKWWTRRYFWHSLPESKGGAPETKRIILVGKTYKILDVGPIYLNNDGSIKFKEYSREFDLKKGPDDKPSGNSWLVKFKPLARFSTSQINNDVLKAVRTVGAKLQFIYTSRYKRILLVGFNINYNFRRNDLVFSFEFTLLQW